MGYGFLFGVFPSIIAEVFGVSKMSQNWGWITLSPALSSNFFNLLYGTVPSVLTGLFYFFGLPEHQLTLSIHSGRIFDSHSVILPGGERRCDESLGCYNVAYYVTFGACLLSIGLSMWCIRQDHILRSKARKTARMSGDAREA